MTSYSGLKLKDTDSPPEEADGLVVQVELLSLRVPPLVAEHQHDPGVELGQRPGHVALASLQIQKFQNIWIKLPS